jgi:3-hydroxybutyryl-CoA dehydrogenase
MTLPTRVGVYGGGRMGSGIAHAFLVGGSDVVVIETDERAADAAQQRIAASLARTTGRVSQGRLTAAVDPMELAGCGLVIEAVPENLELKKQVFAAIERAAPDGWLASNTSSLSIDDIASMLTQPHRLVGMHFFNPVPVSELVEIVAGAATDPRLVQAAVSWVGALRKVAITVRDSPGFASSRLGLALALEAMRMLEEGVGSAEDIDTAMTSGYRHKAGPLRTTDIVGLDVRLAIAEHLAAELGDRFEPPAILRDLVAAGHVGRKANKGFYDWADSSTQSNFN